MAGKWRRGREPPPARRSSSVRGVSARGPAVEGSEDGRYPGRSAQRRSPPTSNALRVTGGRPLSGRAVGPRLIAMSVATAQPAQQRFYWFVCGGGALDLRLSAPIRGRARRACAHARLCLGGQPVRQHGSWHMVEQCRCSRDGLTRDHDAPGRRRDHRRRRRRNGPCASRRACLALHHADGSGPSAAQRSMR